MFEPNISSISEAFQACARSAVSTSAQPHVVFVLLDQLAVPHHQNVALEVADYDQVLVALHAENARDCLAGATVPVHHLEAACGWVQQVQEACVVADQQRAAEPAFLRDVDRFVACVTRGYSCPF